MIFTVHEWDKLYLQYTNVSEQYLQYMKESKQYCDMHIFKIEWEMAKKWLRKDQEWMGNIIFDC
jgi:hypothetical protein